MSRFSRIVARLAAGFYQLWPDLNRMAQSDASREVHIRRILVTGGAGFVGLALADRISQFDGVSLVVVDTLSREHWDDALAEVVNRDNVHYECIDLTDPRKLDGLPGDIDTIIHLAAVVGVEQVRRAPDTVLTVNALATLNVFNYARSLSSLERVLFASTSEVYAGTAQHHEVPIPTPESVAICIEDIHEPRTSYAVSKIYGETVAAAWRRVHRVPTTIVRYHNVYGPRMGFRHVIPETFVKIARSSGVVDVPSANHTRAFCYIDDAVEATIRCTAAAETEGQTIHVGSSRQEIAIGDLVRKVAEVMHREIAIRELPPAPGSPTRRCPDVGLLERLTGFRAAVSLEDGLRRTFAWYRDRLDTTATAPGVH